MKLRKDITHIQVVKNMNKHILLDGLSLINNPKGVQIYLLNLINEYGKINKGYRFTVVTKKGISNLPVFSNIDYEFIPDRYPLLWKLLKLPKYVKQRKFDLVHLIGDSPILGRLEIPYVMTITESIQTYYKVSARSKWKGLKPFLSKNITLLLHAGMFKRASSIIAISKATSEYVKTAYRIDYANIKIIYWAAGDIFFQNKVEKLAELAGREPYLLILDTGDFRENVSVGLKTFAALKNEIPHNLVICGLISEKDMERAKENCRKLDILDRVILLGYMPQEKLALVYKNADIYIDMTLFEGFGLQICEAMASGAPVIVSNAYSLPELVGDAGIMLDPHDVNGLADAIRKIAKDPNEKNRLRQAAVSQAKRFSWGKTAAETLKVYDEVLCQKSQL